jgi:hypothetical protein
MRTFQPAEEEMRRALRDARAADPLIGVVMLEKGADLFDWAVWQPHNHRSFELGIRGVQTGAEYAPKTCCPSGKQTETKPKRRSFRS